jgi:homoserine kinase type II
MAIYTEVSDTDLEAFLAGYDLGRLLTFKGIAEGVENSNFFVHTQSGFYILTLYEKRVAAQDLPYFLGLMEHLAKHGLACPLPVKPKSGDMLGQLAGRPAAVVTFLEGVSSRRPSVAQCAALGDALARLHRAGADFSGHRANALSLAAWPVLYREAGSGAESVQPGLGHFMAKELDFLEKHWPKDLPHGVIHADLFPDNVLFLGEKVSGLIDFYFACNDFLAYDLAVCLNAWCFEPDIAFNITKAMALINAYESIRRLENEEIAALPVLVRGAALRFALTRLVDWLNVPPGALVKPKDPLDYVKRLRFHQHVTGARDLGLMR